jgi:hypothetical protein
LADGLLANAAGQAIPAGGEAMRAVAARLAWCSFVPAGFAAAQPAITDVVNAASRVPSAAPGQAVAAGFPLPTWDGLGGTLSWKPSKT